MFRRALVVLAALTTIGTAIELLTIRHWKSNTQLIPWFALGVLAIAIVAYVVRPTPAVIRVVRVLAVLVALTALIGIYEHVNENLRAGPLDFRYTDKWPTMSTFSRWWAAANKSVGPSPTLAPAVLAQSAACLLLATLRHPALAKRRRADDANDATLIARL
jgi:hypothetical protein